MSMDGKTVLVIGAGRGTGRAVAKALAEAGAKVIAVARTQADLDTLAAEMPGLQIEAADISAEGTAVDLLTKHRPDHTLLVGGITPVTGMLSSLDWDGFSAPWQSDTKAAFLLAQAALATDLPEGATVTTFASGAAIGGSPLSGGYAGAKRMQHYIMNYAQTEAAQTGRGVRFSTIYPTQLITGTQIAQDASTGYARMRGITPEAFMSQWEAPLTPEAIAGHVRAYLDDPQPGAYSVNGTGMAPLA